MEIIEEIGTIVKDNWESVGKPYLLSALGPRIDTHKDEFKTEGLKKWIEKKIDTGELKVKLVQHSSMKEKIGLIPPEEDFKYDDDIIKPQKQLKKNQEIVFDFLLLLNKLSVDDAKSINIPPVILAKLLK